jgi:hypothetical protein
METNIGLIDRIIRVVLGCALLALVAIGPETKLGLLGLIPLLSGMVGFSPIYRRFQIDTVKGWHHKPARQAR